MQDSLGKRLFPLTLPSIYSLYQFNSLPFTQQFTLNTSKTYQVQHLTPKNMRFKALIPLFLLLLSLNTLFSQANLFPIQEGKISFEGKVFSSHWGIQLKCHSPRHDESINQQHIPSVFYFKFLDRLLVQLISSFYLAILLFLSA